MLCCSGISFLSESIGQKGAKAIKYLLLWLFISLIITIVLSVYLSLNFYESISNIIIKLSDENSNNLYTYCYSDQFETCFKIVGNGRNIYTDCFGFWWSGEGKKCTGFRVDGDKFNSVVTNARIDFRSDTDNTVYDGPVTGSGKFVNLLINNKNINANVKYKSFVSDSIWMKFRTFFEKIKNFFLFIGSMFK